ncbi:hypothetical protein ABK040_009513 [Willaertia magna]
MKLHLVIYFLFLLFIVFSKEEDNKYIAYPHVKRPLLLSHRGSRYLIPENTLQAFKTMIALGTNIIEFDIRLTKDNELIVFHDATLNRTTNVNGNVKDFNLKELKELDAGYKFETLQNNFPYRNKGYKISTLREVLQEFYGKEPRELTKEDINMNIEIKDNIDEVSKLLNKELTIYKKIEEHVVIVSRYCSPLEKLYELNNKIPLAACEKQVTKFVLYNQLNNNLFNLKIGKLIFDFENSIYKVYQIPMEHSGMNFSTNSLMKDAKELNVEVHYWVINHYDKINYLIRDVKADGVITDRTDIALKVFNKLNILVKENILKDKYKDYLNLIYTPTENDEEFHTFIKYVVIGVVI